MQHFEAAYAAALQAHVRAASETSLEAGYEIGRSALVDGVSILKVVEFHAGLLTELRTTDAHSDVDARALEFLLQTLAALDVATRGYLDGTRRYAQQRARADELEEANAFRRALVESLQDGFFVADADGTIIEANQALADMLGTDVTALAQPWPYSWVASRKATPPIELPEFLRADGGRTTLRARRTDKAAVWLAISSRRITAPHARAPLFVGTVRDVTLDYAAADLARRLARTSTVSEVVTAGLAGLSSAAGAQRAAVALWDPPDPHAKVFRTDIESDWDGLPEPVREALARCRTDRTGADIIDAGRGSVAAPLGAEGMAAVWLDFRHRPLPTPALLTTLLGQYHSALQRARDYDQARLTSLTLQRAILGAISLPPGFAVLYEPSVAPLEIGGDWYDALPLADGRIGVIIGDCVGRGLAAAAVMGQLRSAARALFLCGLEPGALLDNLDQVARLIEGAACTTVFAALIDPAAGTLTFSNAGHPPPLLATISDHVSLLESARAVPLASFDCERRPQQTIALDPAATLVLYTDGLVERKGASIDDGIHAVVELLHGASRHSAQYLVDTIIREVRPDAGYDDDVAMLVYRQAPAPLVISRRATAGCLSDVRHQVGAWLRTAAVPDERIYDIVLAVDEALTNCIEHAYHDSITESLHVRGTAASGRIQIEVTDTGRWKTQTDTTIRGRGLALIRALANTAEVASDDTGTSVTLTFDVAAVAS
ncbi:SpoIIE family protein phosphatase [Skermania sp. ID1734]|uniref:SpoIIE family protein phosphatase n=1 Tax=Skermania sp. ID1734 TaxID=2597516 RepID=UPI00163D4D6B|nr:SpoIIE family protein phosphatase [Skermania sp. ID1734]